MSSIQINKGIPTDLLDTFQALQKKQRTTALQPRASYSSLVEGVLSIIELI